MEREREVREKEGETRNLRDELQQKNSIIQQTEEEKQRLSRRLDLTNVQIQQTLQRRRQVKDQLREEIHQLQDLVSS